VYTAEQDPLCYPGATVLVNKADLRDQVQLDEFEFSMYVSRAEEPLPGGNLDYGHYCAIHRHLFQDVYAWAGKARSVRIGKGGNWFCYPENLQGHMTTVFSQLKRHNYLAGVDRHAFSMQAADLLAEINAGHPFREGNGRTQLAFLKLIALNAGLPYNDDSLDPVAMLVAMTRSFHRDLSSLTLLIESLVV
jgi:cell filamentation protein